MKAVHVINFLQQLRECVDRPAFDNDFMARIEAILLQVSNGFLAPSQRGALKKIFKERAKQLLEPCYSQYQYTTDPRGCNAPWITLAYWLENIQYSFHLVASLPALTENYVDSFVLVIGSGPNYEPKEFTFSYFDYDAKKIDLLLENNVNFVKELTKLMPKDSTSSVLWREQCLTLSAEDMSHLLTVVKDSGLIIPSYLQILIPSVTNKKSYGSPHLLTSSPGFMDLYAMPTLPEQLDPLEYHNSYIFTSTDNQLFYVTDKKRECAEEHDSLVVERLPLSDGKQFYEKLLEEKIIDAGQKGPSSFSRPNIKKYVTSDTGHIPFELRGFYLNDDNTQLFRIKDLNVNALSKNKIFGIDDLGSKNGRCRALTLQEFLALRSKKGFFPCPCALNQRTYINFWAMFREASIPDWRFPRYIVRKKNEDFNLKNILYLEKNSTTGTIKYTFLKENPSLLKGNKKNSQQNTEIVFGETVPLAGIALDNPFVVRNLFPFILDAMQKNGHRMCQPKLPIGDVLPGLLLLIDHYFSSGANQRTLFKNELNEWEKTFSDSPVVDQLFLLAQPIEIKGVGTRYLIDILLDCKEYALGIPKDVHNPSWGELADKLAYEADLDLTLQLKALAKWLVLQNAALVCSSPVLAPIYKEVALGPSLSNSTLLELLGKLNDGALNDPTLQTFRPDPQLLRELIAQRNELQALLISQQPRTLQAKETLMNKFFCFFEINWRMRRQCDALAPALMNGPWLNLALALAGAQYFNLEAYRGRSPYWLLMPTLESNIHAVMRYPLDYEPLDQYVLSHEQNKLISLSQSEKDSLSGKSPFCNNEESPAREFTIGEWKQVKFADPCYAQYIPFLGYELSLLTDPIPHVELCKIYVRAATKRINNQPERCLEYVLRTSSNEIKHDFLTTKELDLEYELYEPFDIKRLKPFLPDIVQALSLRDQAFPFTKGDLLEMMDIVAIKHLVDDSLNLKGLYSRDLEHENELNQVDQAYIKFFNYFNSRPKQKQDILFKHRFLVQRKIKTIGDVFKNLQKEKAQENEKGIHILQQAYLPKNLTPYLHCYVCTLDTFTRDSDLSTAGRLHFIVSPDHADVEDYKLANPLAFKAALQAKMRGATFLALTPALTNQLIIPFFDKDTRSQHRACAAVNGRSMLRVIFSHAPHAIMCERLEHPVTQNDKENLNLAKYRLGTSRKLVCDSHGAAIRALRLLLVSIMTYNFDLSGSRAGYDIQYGEYRNRVSEEARDIFNECKLLLTAEHHENARYLYANVAYASLMRRLKSLSVDTQASFVAQSPEVDFFTRSYHVFFKMFSGANGESLSTAPSLQISYNAKQWLRKLDDSRLYSEVQWFEPRQLFAKLLSILKREPSALQLWLQPLTTSSSAKEPILSNENVKNLMKRIMTIYEASDSFLAKEVRVNICINQLLNATSRADLRRYQVLLNALRQIKPSAGTFNEHVHYFRQTFDHHAATTSVRPAAPTIR